MKNKIKTVKHYEITQTREKPIILDTFHDMQDVADALGRQGKQFRAFTVFTDGTREQIHNLI